MRTEKDYLDRLDDLAIEVNKREAELALDEENDALFSEWVDLRDAWLDLFDEFQKWKIRG